jgi:3-oxoacyl-[acyl-carrier protein] reductase
MDLGIAGKVAIVSAASEGLGKATALRLAREGARVAICARNHAALDRAASEIAAVSGGQPPLAIPTDLTDPAAIERFVAQVVAELGPPAILVTNTGGPPSGPVLSFSDTQWQAAFDLVFFSALRLIRLVVPHMQAAGWGRVVAISSVSVKQPLDALVLSNASRSALQAFLKTLATQLAPQGITVNNVGPGPIATNRMIQLIEGATQRGMSLEEARESWIREIPIGRLGEAEELADMVAFLCSANASFVTGTFIPVDGGRVRGLL